MQASQARVSEWRWSTPEYSQPGRRAASLGAQKHRSGQAIFCEGLFIAFELRAEKWRLIATPHSKPFK